MRTEVIGLDSDGTLVNTKELIFQSYEHTLGWYKAPIPPRDYMATLMGNSLEANYALLMPSYDKDHLCRLHREYQQDNRHLAEPFPNVLSTLEALNQAGKKLAVITARARASAIDILNYTGIFERVDFVIAGGDCTNHKPHPEPLQRVMERYSVEPAQTLMVGDTDVDIMTGKNAGTKTVGVTYGFCPTIVEYEPDYVIDDISKLITIALMADS